MSTSKALRAFTLIEIVTVVGIFVILAGATVVLGLDGFRGYTFRTDRDNLIASLQRARAAAMGNVCNGAGCTDGRPHGVYVEAGKYTIFQGPCYACTRDADDAAVDEYVDASTAVSVAGAPKEVMFTQLSGTSTAQTFVMSDATGRTSTITVESEGRIWWTN